MKKNFLATLAAATLVAGLSGMALAQNIAIVNGKAIPKERMDALAQEAAQMGRPVGPEAQGQMREELILREMLAQEAVARGLDATEDYRIQAEMNRQRLLIRQLVLDHMAKNPVTDAEIQAEYDRFVAANQGKEYKARHILVEKEAQAKDVVSQLKKGAKFEALAKKLSKDPGSGANGGELDWSNPGGFVKEFSDAMVALAKGKYTETPVKSQFGFHIIRLDDVRQPALPKLEEVKPQIAQQLRQQRLAKLQDDLRAKARIE